MHPLTEMLPAPDAKITEKCIGILLLNRTEECEGHGRKTNLKRKDFLEQFEGGGSQPKRGISFIRHFNNKVKNQRIKLGNEEYVILKIMYSEKKIKNLRIKLGNEHFILKIMHFKEKKSKF